MGKKKFCAISDLHGILPEIKDKPDILLVAGDIVPLDVQMNSRASKRWLKEEFIPFCEKNCKDMAVVVGGNHDMWLANHGKEDFVMMLPPEIEYLENEVLVINDEYAIFGTPLCHKFGNWWFMLPDNDIRRKLEPGINEMNGYTDKKKIMLCHDAPYGVSDVLLQKMPWTTGEHIGSKPLFEACEKVKPDYLLHGHLHSTNHEAETMNDGKTEVRNVSIVDERYNHVYEPFYFEL